MGFFVGNAIITDAGVEQQKQQIKRNPPSFAELRVTNQSAAGETNQKPKRNNKTSAYMQDLMNK